MQLPEPFRMQISRAFGTAGREWLADLPALIAHYSERWGLRVGAAFGDLSYNLVLQAQDAHGVAVVLKLGVPRHELRTEIAALGLYNGLGAVRLLASDGPGGALLLERLQPGGALRDHGDDAAATAIAADLMRQLRPPPPATHEFPSVADWFRGFERLHNSFGGGTGPFPAQLIDRSMALYRELSADQAAPVVLHGDLHHANIIQSERGWLAIDPKGVIGEPAYEAGALLRNPLDLPDWPDLRQVISRRSAILAERLGLERQRVLGWAAAQAVLSAWWTYEDDGPAGDWRRWLGPAQIMFEAY